MLTEEMTELIFLLKEISYMQGYAVREQSLPEPFRSQAREQLERLLCHQLLRVVVSCPSDSLFSCYALSRPLKEITLYDLLVVCGGHLHLSLNDSTDLSVEYGPVGRRLGVLVSMLCRFMSEISVVEVVLPAGYEWEGLRKEVRG